MKRETNHRHADLHKQLQKLREGKLTYDEYHPLLNKCIHTHFPSETRVRGVYLHKFFEGYFLASELGTTLATERAHGIVETFDRIYALPISTRSILPFDKMRLIRGLGSILLRETRDRRELIKQYQTKKRKERKDLKDFLQCAIRLRNAIEERKKAQVALHYMQVNTKETAGFLHCIYHVTQYANQHLDSIKKKGLRDEVRSTDELSRKAKKTICEVVDAFVDWNVDQPRIVDLLSDLLVSYGFYEPELAGFESSYSTKQIEKERRRVKRKAKDSIRKILDRAPE